MKTIFSLLSIFLATALNVSAHDFDGTYYVGEPNYEASLEHPWKRGFQSVEMKYTEKEYMIELTYDAAQRPMKAFPSHGAMDVVKKGSCYVFLLSNVGPNCLTNADMLLIEPGVWVVAPATQTNTAGEVSRATKSSAPSKGGKVSPVESLVREFILGKDKERVKYLCEHPAEFQAILLKAVNARYAALSTEIANTHPAPAEGMTDATLKKEILGLIQKWAVAKKWTQEVSSTYIKSTGWEDLRENGKVVGRQIVCVVIMTQNGNCKWQEYIVRQDYSSGAYGASYVFGELPGAYATACK